jgi:multidrug efflux pump subunit AcrB
VIDGAENARSAHGQRHAGVIINIQRQPGANVIEVVDASSSCCRRCRHAAGSVDVRC